MSRNIKNILMFLVAVVALAVFAYNMCQLDAGLGTWNYISLTASIIVGIWYVWHVITDNY